MHSNFQNILDPYLDCAPTNVVLGYSGGVDSHVLLHLVAKCQSRFPQHQYQAVYVDHGLSANSKAWQQHCEQQCQLLAMPFSAKSVTVTRQNRTSLEASARDARYAALQQCLPQGGILLLGQHGDDQVETFLLQLKRGAGPKGLGAMAQDKPLNAGIRMIRPLLQMTRDDIEAYAQQADLKWIEDESNQNIAFDRNFLRHNITPLLRQRWPELAKSVTRSAKLCAEQQSLLDEIVAQRLTEVTDEKQRLSIVKLSQFSIGWQHQIVRAWLSEQRAPTPSFAILQQLSGVISAPQGADPVLNWQDHQIRRFQGNLYLTKSKQYPQNSRISLSPGQSLNVKLNDTQWLIRDTSAAESGQQDCNISVEYDGFAKRFRPIDAKHSKPLKQWFKEWQIPTWERARIAQIIVGDEVLALIYDHQLIASALLSSSAIEMSRPDITA